MAVNIKQLNKNDRDKRKNTTCDKQEDGLQYDAKQYGHSFYYDYQNNIL